VEEIVTDQSESALPATGASSLHGPSFLQEDSAPEIARLIGSLLDRLDVSEGKK
jgi:hypothetical protein